MSSDDKYREMIEMYLAGALDANGEKELLAHVETCDECSAMLADAKEFEKLMVRSLGRAGGMFREAKPIAAIAALKRRESTKFFSGKLHKPARFRNIVFFATVAALVLMMITFFSYVRMLKKDEINKQNELQARTEMRAVLKALDAHVKKTGRTPVKTSDLYSVLTSGILPGGGSHVDPWGNPYKTVVRDGSLIGIRSYGRNASDDFGGGDDLVIFLIDLE